MSRIYLDARNITDQPAGVARYARSLIMALVERAPHHEFVVIRHRSNMRPLFVDELDNLVEIPVAYDIDGLQNFLFGHRALQSVIARAGAPDLFHSLFHILPLKIRSVIHEIPVVVTLHDFVWLDHPDASQPTFLKARTIQAFARTAIPHALQNSERVIAISEPTRRRARHFIDDASMVTISHGVDEVFFKPPGPLIGPFADLIDPDRPCVVAIGNHKPYKNLGLLIDAFSRLIDSGVCARLVLIGDCERLSSQIDEASASEWITFTGFVDDEMLRRIMGHARAFVHPSKVEGFGLPILEAMAMGIPTVVADVEPMRSIAGEAALRFDPDDPDALCRLLARILEDDGLADRLAIRGRRRASIFRWDKSAAETLAIYDELLGR